MSRDLKMGPNKKVLKKQENTGDKKNIRMSKS